ncbi:hypothetical protein EG68_02728 [Paragonimus skrjabini miyazakii]|uniref:Centrosomal protein of 78 kDa n=1 Tax=Paragonimus skrjabini miyazakii TaxID=59628 RepID=A0A8S9Z4R5_9TREM|nr:hypothetical protein EG68_02728 [Paragonimus skrjabini miyazakii]
MQRHNAAWQESLRYRLPALDQLGGLRRMTLNDNPAVGDVGSTYLAEALMDDLWVKAVDMQACALSDKSAMVWLRMLLGTPENVVNPGGVEPIQVENLGNRTLVVLDLRRNPDISRELLRAVTERALVNSEGKQTEFHWLRAGPNASTHLCSGVVVYPWPGIIGMENSHRLPPGKSQRSRPVSSSSHANPYVQNLKAIRSSSARPANNVRNEVNSARSANQPFSARLRSQSLSCNRCSSSELWDRQSGGLKQSCARPVPTHTIWRPPGVYRAPQRSSSPEISLANPVAQQCVGIPWRTAARASRCCRGYPINQHPGQTCLDSRALRLNQQLLVNQTIGNHPHTKSKIVPSPGLMKYSNRYAPLRKFDNDSCGFTPRQNPRNSMTNRKPELQMQLKKLMMRVAQLETQLNKEKQKSRTTTEQNICVASGDQEMVGLSSESTAAGQLNEFVTHLQPLINRIQTSPSDQQETNVLIANLQKNLTTLCTLIEKVSERIEEDTDDLPGKNTKPMAKRPTAVTRQLRMLNKSCESEAYGRQMQLAASAQKTFKEEFTSTNNDVCSDDIVINQDHAHRESIAIQTEELTQVGNENQKNELQGVFLGPPLVSDMPKVIDQVNNHQHQRKPKTPSMIDSVVPQRREQHFIVTTRDNLTTCDSSWVRQSKSNSVNYERSESWATTTVRGSPSDRDCRTATREPTACEPNASNDSLFHNDQHVTGATVFAKCKSESKPSSAERVQPPTSPNFDQSKNRDQQHQLNNSAKPVMEVSVSGLLNNQSDEDNISDEEDSIQYWTSARSPRTYESSGESFDKKVAKAGQNIINCSKLKETSPLTDSDEELNDILCGYSDEEADRVNGMDFMDFVDLECDLAMSRYNITPVPSQPNNSSVVLMSK